VKKIGIVGGVAWQTTVEYYSGICARSKPSTPEITIESLDLSRAVSYLGMDDAEDSWSAFDEYHRAALRRLQASGADFALIASNTPHHRFETIVRGIQIPVINIFETVAMESARIGAKEVLILGTELTMRSQVFRDQFKKYGIEAAGPYDDRARAMTVELISRLQAGKANGAIERLGRIAKIAFKRPVKPQPVVCLACTELSLAFQRRKMLATFDHDGIVYIDSTAAHINAAFDFAVIQSECR
jgi:aspartate racemase